MSESHETSDWPTTPAGVVGYHDQLGQLMYDRYVEAHGEPDEADLPRLQILGRFTLLNDGDVDYRWTPQPALVASSDIAKFPPLWLPRGTFTTVNTHDAEEPHEEKKTVRYLGWALDSEQGGFRQPAIIKGQFVRTMGTNEKPIGRYSNIFDDKDFDLSYLLSQFAEIELQMRADPSLLPLLTFAKE